MLSLSRRRVVPGLLAALLLLSPLAACNATNFGDLVQVGEPQQAGRTADEATPRAPSTPSSKRARTPTPPVYTVRPVPRPEPPLVRQPTPGVTSAGDAAAAAEPQTTVVSGADDGRIRVALLLPLSGQNGQVGRAMLNAAQLALFDFADERFQLLTHDTRGTPEGAAEAAQLAIGDGAELILGPLLSQSVDAVRPVVQPTGVPVIAFSSDRTVAGAGIYTLGFVPTPQVDRVIAFARQKGLQRFAALVPNNVYGQTVIDAFKQSVVVNGGEIARIQYYDPNAQDFADVVRDMADYDERRANLLAQRHELEGRDDEISQNALKRLETLQTIGDLPYDALMVADGGKRLQAIAALLPFYDIDPGKVRILGTGQWDEPGIGAEPALVGGWYAAPSPQSRRDFEKQYADTYGQQPPRLATLSYDATALAAVLAQAAAQRAAAAGTKAVTDPFPASALLNPNGFAGRDGIFRFQPDGTAQRGLAVLQVRQRDARVIDPAPTTFQSLTN